MTGNESGMSSRRCVIIHGHFYQPPRENPWLDIIEQQASAAPYSDWNERIYDECYRPNAFSRLLDPNGMIIDILNNYQHLSFNFGPTLFSWLLRKHPKIAQRIIDADLDSRKRLSNHGNAICQVYNHIIMPLSSRRDQLTQIRWAKTFFRSCFDREPEGIWLAETAINMETVSCLVEEGIRFVILSPSQAERIRPLSGGNWTPAAAGLDTRRPYRLFPVTRDNKSLPGFLDIFFFNEPLSREASFGDILNDARRFGSKIRSCFDEHSQQDAAVVIATDGETFGHHKPLSDMCLAYFFRRVAPEMNIMPVNFGYYLETHPPTWEVALRNGFGEGTAWSCVHGVGRWSRDCGCRTGGQASWKQEWRSPLRSAVTGLQRRIDATYEKTLSPLFADPWKVRDAYQTIACTRSLEEMKKTIEAHGALRPLSVEQALVVRRLLEAQKFILCAFTSCGWFFSDVSGIETAQNIAFAARALQLCIEMEEREKAEGELLAALAQARSNLSNITGKTLYESEVARYLHFQETIAFTAVAEKIILHEEKPHLMEFDFGNFNVSMTYRKSYPYNHAGVYHSYSVDVQRIGSFESARFYVLIRQNRESEISGVVLPVEAARDGQLIMDDPQAWSRHKDAVPMDLSAIFQESKALMARHFLDQLSRDTRHKYAAWMDRNEKIISCLCRLNYTIPDYVLAPIAFIISDEWNTTINELEVYGQEEAVFSRLQHLWEKARQYTIAIDFTKTARLVEQLLSAEITIFASSLSPVTCVRMGRLLDIVDTFAIPIAKNKIEDAFYSILNGAIRPLYEEYKKDPFTSSSNRESLDALINFARRMNFNTDEFSMSQVSRK